MAEQGFGRSLLASLRTRALQVRAGEFTETDAGRSADVSPEAYAEIFNALLRNSLDSVILNDRASRAFIEVSDSFCRLTGYRREELLGRTSVELGLVDPDGVHAVSVSRADAGQDGVYQSELIGRDGTVRFVEYTQQLLGDEFVLTILRDISARRDLESDLRRLTDTDALTGVLNRRRFAEEVEAGLRMAARYLDAATLVVVDIDGLRDINDLHGAEGGDLALQDLADALRETVRETDTVGRVGGDEFAALLIRHDADEPRRVIREVTERLRDGRFAATYGHAVTATFGLTHTSGQANLEAMLAEVAEAMTLSKAARA